MPDSPWQTATTGGAYMSPEYAPRAAQGAARTQAYWAGEEAKQARARAPGEWFRKAFKGSAKPAAPTQAELYGGPAAFGGHQTEESRAATSGPGMSAQMAALGDMQGIARTGWSATDTAAQNQAQRQAAQAEQAQRGAVMQQAAARGQSGGGLAMMGALQAQQGAANRSLDAATNIATQGAERRMAATGAAGQMGAQLTGQAMQGASSNDQFNQWASGQSGAARQQVYSNAMGSRDPGLWDRISGATRQAASFARSGS